VPLKVPAGTNNNQQSSRVSEPHKLLTEEWVDRQRKGLCFKCGERWRPNHMSKLKNYQIYILEDVEAIESEEDQIRQQENQRENELVLEKLELQLSSYSLGISLLTKPLRLKARYKIVKLLSSFIQEPLQTSLQQESSKNYSFRLQELGNFK